MTRFNETPRIEALNSQHMDALILADISGSVTGKQMANINANLNRFKSVICQDERAAKCVHVGVIAFDDDVHVLQDWCPVGEMKSFELTAGGMTNLNGAVTTGITMIRDHGRMYAKEDVELKKPYLIVLTDGCDTVTGNVEAAARLATERIEAGKLKLFFLGFGDYDKHTAAQLTAGNGSWCFEVNDGEYDFNDFFDFAANSIKAASVSAPHEELDVDTNINTSASNVHTVDLKDFLNS